MIHTAAQPSHDWAASDPHTDFAVNALGTLVRDNIHSADLVAAFEAFHDAHDANAERWLAGE